MFEIRNDPSKENRNFIRCFILYEFDFPSNGNVEAAHSTNDVVKVIF